MKTPRIACALLLALAPFVPSFGQALTGTSLSVTGGGASTLSGNLTVSGTLGAVGTIDSASNTLIFGTQSGLDAVTLQYTDSTTDTLKFLINRNPASWAWIHNTNVTAMRLDSNHQLILYNAAGTTAGVTLTPGSNRLSLGTATLTGSGDNLSMGGALTVTSGITNTNGTLTGGSTGLTLNAGGTNQNITLTPSGSGYTILNGNVGIGTSTPAVKLDVTNAAIGDIEVARFLNPNIGVGNYGYINVGGTDSQFSGAFLGFQKTGTGTGLASLGVRGSGSTISINQLGNVGIGTSSPTYALSFGPNFGKTVALYEGAGGANLYGISMGGNAAGGADPYRTKLFANGSEFMSVTYVGNVGIGTTTPGLTLDVNGPVRSNSGSIDVRLQAGAAGAAGIGSFSNDPLLLISAAVERARIDTAGNVGIGLQGPAGYGKLAVAGTIASTSPDNGTVATLQGDNTGLVSLGSYRNATNTQIRFNTGNSAGSFTEKMRIDQSGNVGIGTIAPASRLDVAGDGSNALVIAARSRQANTYLDLFAGASDDAVGEFSFERTGTNAGNIYVGGNATGNIQFRSGGYTGRMIINSVGNVGIGTTIPTGKLQLGISNAANVSEGIELARNGGATSRFSMKLKSDASGYYRGALEFTPNGGTTTEVMSFANETGGNSGLGNVGIGTTTPSGKLEVSLVNPSGWNGNLKAARIMSPDSSYYLDLNSYIIGAGNVGYHFSPNGTIGLVIGTNGNVGIGTTTPTHKLSVNGTIRAKEIIVDTGWADYVFDANYRLAPLSEVESHIKAEQHLPGIPSAAEIAEHGVSMGDMQAKLLSKIEEITLHQIAQEKELLALKAQNAHLQQQIVELKAAAHP